MDEQRAVDLIKQIAALDPLDTELDGKLSDLQNQLLQCRSQEEVIPSEAGQILNEIANLDWQSPAFDSNLQALQERIGSVKPE